ncbi:hypothetical protein LCGC14_0354300 [marine sediment metagenome]|uniref:Uncharacterized protein n=1 Tax=marine sediment metagenome TaxID=412755 RepID=A0A0F9T9U8_9ZZZZ|nr:hypothetical protein [Maribacter sp.]HDZ04676.1 hypothetical protein [Maribacter sp.]
MKPELELPDISIDSFLSEKNYLSIKKDFFVNDDQFKGMDSLELEKAKKEQKGNIPVSINRHNELGEEFEYTYIEDYLKPLSNKLVKSFYKKVKPKASQIYGPNARIDFIIEQRDKLLNTITAITKARYIHSLEKKEIIVAMDKLLDKLEEKKRKLLIKKSKKIQLNLKKGEAVFFFQMLNELGLFKGATIYDLMDFIEENFTYSGGLEITNANKERLKYLSRNLGITYNETTLLDFYRKNLKN